VVCDIHMTSLETPRCVRDKIILKWSLHRGSSVSMVSGYGLDDSEIQVRPAGEANNFSCSLCVQTGSDAYLSCPMGTRGLFPGVDTDHAPPSSVEVVNE
jgi:hypothetical protein